MGTKVQNLPGHYSMRDLNEESNSCGWPLFYGDKTLTNRQYYNNYFPSVTADACSVYDKDVMKRTMLEHEAIFKNQVYELHQLYRIQRDLMNEVKRKELHRNHIPVEASFSADRLASQIVIEECQKWHISDFPGGNSTCAKTSVSGVEGIHSPLDSIKGINNQSGSPFPSSNRCSSKDIEVLESRPSKVRRKMFDLLLPADSYIDTKESEKLSDEKMNGPTLFLPDRNCKNGKESDLKLFCGIGVKTSHEDTSRSEQFPRRKNDLADLNEPYQGVTECSNPSDAAKQPQFFGLSREHLHKSHHGTDIWPRKNGYLDNNGRGKGWIMSAAEAGQAKNSIQPVPQAPKLEKSPLSSQTVHDALRKAHEAAASDYLTDRSKTDWWTEKTISGLYFSKRNSDHTINKHPESVKPLHRPGLFVVSPSSDLSKSWSHSASLLTPSSLNNTGDLSRSSQSHKSNRILDDRRPLNINSKPNSGFPCHLPMQNGFPTGSLSRSKETSRNISSISYNYLNHNNDFKIVSQHSINNGPCKDSNSNFNDLKSRNIDLNVMLSNCSSDNLVSQSGNGIMDGEKKHEEPHAVLPLVPIFDMRHISPKKEMSSITSYSNSILNPSDVEVVQNNRKNQLFDMNLPCDADGLELGREAATGTIVSRERCPTKEANSRNQFDLNLCMSEDEASLTTIPSDSLKMKEAIDPEARAVLENEEDSVPEEKQLENSPESPKGPVDTVEQTHDELMRQAAESIVVLSSFTCHQVDSVTGNPSDSQMADPLSWFVDVISSCKDNLESKLENLRGKSGDDGEESSSSKGMDYFEAMTLKLPETKEEDYMPKPLVPETFIVEETMTLLPTRTRKGPARRGRQRRDFKKDILPGLVSLSRNEMTEDLQTFGELMRATGHSWCSGSTRRSSSRNGGGRGRRRVQVAPSLSPVATVNETCIPLIQQLNNIEAGLEDRSLIGWGKTTRRPRRQRCTAGNPPSIPLT
ncbi:PREDICTED: uncharacterized protein LOC109337225 isoform X2 [Lupinus angustifolius]|uniref:uncharacterized protein LOC109337225 isoform X2 n=1 Tax=Lupinus angustifolius TaxID=3871 RepID=UPI00092F5EBF|nr:PREDICTED: uncharacterized protein LOC109337225 isoform X2 [Lupinus angustifolius]